MKNILILDKDNKALNLIVIENEAQKFVEYEGAFYPGAIWDGEKLIDPNYLPEEDGEIEVA